MNLVTTAREFARNAHSGQLRKYHNKPYFVHPERVAIEVLKIPTSTDEMVAAAYLHDVIEDCGISYQTLFDRFGSKVADYVLGLTSYSKQINSKTFRYERKKMDLEYLAKQSKEVHIIKLEDRYDNLQDLRGTNINWYCEPDFRHLYANETKDLLDVIGYANPTRAEQISYLINMMKDV